ncbi:hypothetical protein Prudu_020469 [Prunus dulcis]|uniref:Uncharacterized protein n=1 Tax=Prunus dulcis TaxID=3755 RepID=A0A4Y1RX35_PRUDU|nr:hypothetical protein Prudu_020469 [Prunus dulcis]
MFHSNSKGPIMGDRCISQFSVAAAELTSSQGHALTMASHQDDLLGKISEMEKSMGKISEMEKTLGQLLDWSKSITQELRLRHPGPPVMTEPLPLPRLPEDWEHASMTDDEHANAVYEVKFKHGGEVTHESPVVRHVAKFRKGSCHDAARILNHSKLYCIGEDGGFIVDTESWSKCSSIPPIPASKSLETVVCAYGKVYYLACPSTFSPITGPSFGRYDHDQKTWKEMTPFPFYDDYDYSMQITGYAVCYGAILFSLSGLRKGKFGVVAFHVGRKDWNRVKIDTSAYYAPPFQGRAVVVDETIYALYGESKIIAFSFTMDKHDDNGIHYSLRQLFILQGLEFERPTGWCDGYLKVQYLSITTFQIVAGEGGRHMIKTIYSTLHSVDIKGSEWFDLVGILVHFVYNEVSHSYDSVSARMMNPLD